MSVQTCTRITNRPLHHMYMMINI